MRWLILGLKPISGTGVYFQSNPIGLRRYVIRLNIYRWKGPQINAFLDTARWRKVWDQQILAKLAVYVWVGRLLGLQ